MMCPVCIYVSVLWYIGAFFSTAFIAVLTIIGTLFDSSGRWGHRCAMYWGKSLIRLAFCKVKVTGLEHLDKGKAYLFIANHSSSFDIFLLNGYLPFEFRWISKASYFNVPVFGNAMKKAGYILIQRDKPMQAMRALLYAVDTLKQGKSIVIFPEGTRSRTGELQDFKKGTLVIASKAGAEVVPLTIRNTFEAKKPGSFWVIPSLLEIVIHEPVLIEKCMKEEDTLESLKATISSSLP
jgi:1-acyl-sn-glycerol-3-phosphate acyltransferase